ncbi:MAG TPA: addiction module protein [Methylomirabilota bacterium]|nr:addiction module protein [Methylomirabilota bacterium]
MSATEILEQIEQLPPDEQHEVAEKVFEKYGGFDDELTPEQIAELERRAAEARAHPERCRPLEDVMVDIEKRYRAQK